jgi:hypothetical protein
LQAGWPTQTLRNPHKSPLRKFAAWLRGLRDLFVIWAEDLLQRARQIEELDEAIEKKLGANVWKRVSLG